MGRRWATDVNKILNHAKPGNLPVEHQAAVNLKAAKGMGLLIPESFVIGADEGIE